MKFKKFNKERQGQSLVEFALVLPVLILLIIGMVELGFAFYSYMTVANANREGGRLAARGVFTDPNIARRILATAGMREIDPGVYEPNLRTLGVDPNTGILIIHVPIYYDSRTDQASLDLADIRTYVTGTLPISGTVRPLAVSDSRVLPSIDEFDVDRYIDMTEVINAMREEEGYEVQNNELVIVETFMGHKLVMNYPAILPLEDPLPLYFSSIFRVTLGTRSQQSGN